MINGLRCEELAPGRLCAGLCYGHKENNKCEPLTCDFLKMYRLQLETTFNIKSFLKRCEIVAKRTKQRNNYIGEPLIVLLVHEAPTNPCSERKTLINFFNSRNIKCEELHIDKSLKI